MLLRLVQIFLKFPLRVIAYAGSISKNALYVMALVMLLDYMHLQNQILKVQILYCKC
jgi:hypothetical protein